MRIGMGMSLCAAYISTPISILMFIEQPSERTIIRNIHYFLSFYLISKRFSSIFHRFDWIAVFFVLFYCTLSVLKADINKYISTLLFKYIVIRCALFMKMNKKLCNLYEAFRIKNLHKQRQYEECKRLEVKRIWNAHSYFIIQNTLLCVLFGSFVPRGVGNFSRIIFGYLEVTLAVI